MNRNTTPYWRQKEVANIIASYLKEGKTMREIAWDIGKSFLECQYLIENYYN